MKKVVVISGGNDGLGKEIAKILGPNNDVIILVRSKDKALKTIKEIPCDFEICDIKDYSQIEKSIKSIYKKYKKIDCVINNAGVWTEGELDENDFSEIENAINTNTLGTIFLSKATIPYFKKQKSGLIINIISQAGIYAKAKRTVYNASKWAITGFTKSLQPELADYGIRVTGIYPGKMNTGLFRKKGIEKDMSDAISASEVAKTIEFILSFGNVIEFPEVGIKHVKG